MSTERADAVVVGVGWVGGIMAAELTKAGLDVIALERGPYLQREAGAFEGVRDDLVARRRAFTQNTRTETWTLRHHHREDALPFRYAGSFTPGSAVGGSSLLYGAHAFRLSPYDFVARSAVVDRYGAAAIPEDSTLADWGITYDELAPDYDRFELMAGIAGRAGNIDGTLRDGGNPFEGPRSSDYPLPPMEDAPGPAAFRDACARLGLHPFPLSGGTLSRDYVNPDGIARPACTYCGHCAGHPCTIGAKADATATVLPVALRTGRLDLRPDSYVVRVLHDGERAYGVRYYDARGEPREVHAERVILAAYALNNVRLLLLSEMGTPYDPYTGEGVVGRNYGYNFVSINRALFAGRRFGGRRGSGSTGFAVADFNADNFDHSGEGFLGGGLIFSATVNASPLRGIPLPPGTPSWGLEWKRALREWQDRAVTVMAHGEVLPYRQHHLDLDPTYRDAWGEPLLRITFDWRDNERRMYAFLQDRVAEILHAMGADHVLAAPSDLPPRFDTATYQSTHNLGGAIMGTDTSSSVVDPWLRMWEFENVWVVGGSAFPQGPGVGPTETICALAYRAADGILGRAGAQSLVST